MMHAIALAALLALTLAGCGEPPAPPPAPGAATGPDKPAPKKHDDDHGEETAGVELTDDEARAAGVRTETLEWSAAGGEIAVTGVIQPNLDRYAQVAPRVPARIVRVQAALGDRVRAGQPLAMLDGIEVGEARAALAQAEAEREVAEAAFRRAESLRADNVVPEKDYLRARGDLEKARAAAAAAREKLRTLGVGAERLHGEVSHFAVFAPFAGTIVEKTAVAGALADSAKALFIVADLSTVWIESDVFEKDLPRLTRGAPASVSVAAWPGAPAKGRLTYVARLMDKETRTVKARIEVPNADGRLLPGMFANVAIGVPAAPAAGGGKILLVPEDAVVLVSGKPTVFVRGEHGFAPRPVATGERRQGRVELRDGVAAGENVVVAGAYELKARLQKSQLGEGHAH